MLMPVYLPLLPDPLCWLNRATATDLVESPLANGLPMRALHLFEISKMVFVVAGEKNPPVRKHRGIFLSI